MRDYRGVDCDVAREALSARLDGEREPVPSARVDEHVASCPHCRAWYADTRAWTLRFRSLTGRSGPNLTSAVPGSPQRGGRRIDWLRIPWERSALVFVGVVQIAIAVAQACGADFGMVAGHHGTMTGAHLLNESTAWSFALGAAMVVAGIWPVAAAGLTCVLAVFTVVLSCYVAGDGFSGQVTGVRLLSHLPVVAATVLAFLVWRSGGPGDTSSRSRQGETGTTAPDDATPGRRGHLRAADDSAA